MYVALGTTSEGFRGTTGALGERGCCTSGRPILEFDEEYVERDDRALR